MFRTQEMQDRAVEAARVENAKKQCIAEVYAARQDFRRCVANDKAIIEVIERWTGNPDVLPTKAIFDEALLENPEEINNFARQSLGRAHGHLVSEILTLLAAGGSYHDAFTLKAEENKLKHFSLEALRVRRDEIVEKQRLSKLSVTQIRQEQAAAQPKTHRYHPYELLDPQITADGLKKILRSSEARMYLRRFGSAQLNDRLFGRS
jgi:hypothetical protein